MISKFKYVFLLNILLLQANAFSFSWWPFSSDNRVVGSGNIVKQNREVGVFNKILVKGLGVVELIQGDTESLVIECDDNILPLIEIKTMNNELKILWKDNSNISIKNSVKFIVTCRNIENINITGSVSLRSQSIKAKKLSINSSGSVDLAIKVLVDYLDISSFGSSVILINGKVSEKCNVDISGSSKYLARGLALKDIFVSASGSCYLEVNALNNISGNISGVSTLKIKGDAQVDVNTSGSSKIIR